MTNIYELQESVLSRELESVSRSNRVYVQRNRTSTVLVYSLAGVQEHVQVQVP